jgi:hypothetical protein
VLAARAIELLLQGRIGAGEAVTRDLPATVSALLENEELLIAFGTLRAERLHRTCVRTARGRWYRRPSAGGAARVGAYRAARRDHAEVAVPQLRSLDGPSGQSAHPSDCARIQRIRGTNGANALSRPSDLNYRKFRVFTLMLSPKHHGSAQRAEFGYVVASLLA